MGTYFGDKMKQFRKEQKLTLDQLAERIGSSKQVLSRYERGERIPRISDANKIAMGLGVELSEMADLREINSEQVEQYSPSVQKLLDYAKTVPDDKADLVLRMMKAILADESK